MKLVLKYIDRNHLGKIRELLEIMLLVIFKDCFCIEELSC